MHSGKITVIRNVLLTFYCNQSTNDILYTMNQEKTCHSTSCITSAYVDRLLKFFTVGYSKKIAIKLLSRLPSYLKYDSTVFKKQLKNYLFRLAFNIQ